ncbi:MAG: DUF1329 domain-containing protein [Nevskiales bacterium]
MLKSIATYGSAACLALAMVQAHAKVSAEEAAKLGAALTPVGAEKAGNADKSIPEWTGGDPKEGELAGFWAPSNKYAAEQPVYTITKDNMAQYVDKLSEGHKSMLSRFATYKMPVYKTARSVGWPQEIYDATKLNATTAELVGGNVDSLKGAKLGFPFPMPASGAEPVWNHRLKWRGESVRRYNNQLIVQPSGDKSFSKLIEDVKFGYASIKSPGSFEKPDEIAIYYLSETKEPPRVAGQFLLAWEHPTTRSAWIYNPGLRRIRKAPNVCCDNPYEGTDGQQFYDQVDMFNGELGRYTWKLVGKKEMIIPYNNHKINQKGVKYDAVTKKGHLDQDYLRYELHRVWVVEGDLRAGTNHTFKKRRFYIDEDSWAIALVDNYDKRDQLYKFQEGALVYASNVQTVGGVPETIYDLQSGGYFVTALFTEDKANDFSVSFESSFFTPDSVKKRTTR